jgi:hypothetical protein
MTGAGCLGQADCCNGMRGHQRQFELAEFLDTAL